MVLRALPLLAVLVLGCTNKLTGSVEVDGKTFKPTACYNMQRIGQSGVELEDDSSHRIRVIERPDGGADVFYFTSSSGKGQKFGDCATLTLKGQNSTVNKVKNVMGKVKFDCHKDDEEISGSVTFENCH